MPEQTDASHEQPHREWLVFAPKLRQGSYDTVRALVEDPVAPVPPAQCVVFVPAENIFNALHNPDRVGFPVLLGDQNIAIAIADLIHKLGKARRVGQIQQRIRLQCVPVSARDHRLFKALGQIEDRAILLPRPQSVQFEGMDKLSVDFYKLPRQSAMSLFANSFLVPVRMIEDDQGSRIGGDILQQGSKPGRRPPGERGQISHRLTRQVGVEIVDTQMEEGMPVRDRPLHRNGSFAALLQNRERQGALDIVMVRQRDLSVPAEVILNAIGFEQPCVMRSERRRPPRARKIERAPVNALVSRLAAFERDAQRRDPLREAVNEIQPLAGVQRVPVKRYCRPKTPPREMIGFKEKVGGSHARSCEKGSCSNTSRRKLLGRNSMRTGRAFNESTRFASNKALNSNSCEEPCSAIQPVSSWSASRV